MLVATPAVSVTAAKKQGPTPSWSTPPGGKAGGRGAGKGSSSKSSSKGGRGGGEGAAGQKQQPARDKQQPPKADRKQPEGTHQQAAPAIAAADALVKLSAALQADVLVRPPASHTASGLGTKGSHQLPSIKCAPQVQLYAGCRPSPIQLSRPLERCC